MTDEKFEELMRDVAQAYNNPPVAPPYDEMWRAIERELPQPAKPITHAAVVRFPERRTRVLPAWLKMAAVLVIGVALGRFSLTLQPFTGATSGAQTNATAPAAAYHVVTDRYLGETAALLIALPSELKSSATDSVFNARANDLLLQTRLLLDSPAATDPALRTLFEDLEMVLVQIVRLQAGRDSVRIELLNEALEHGNVIPRLRNAVVQHIGD